MQKSEKEKLVARLRRAADAQRRAYSGNLYHEGIAQGLDDAAGILGKVRCEEEQRWIPCSERLPEADKEVLISYRYKEGEGDTSHTYIDITTYGYMYFGGRMVNGEKYWRPPFEYFNTNYDVIAWMPLPEPWKGEEDGRSN